MQSRESVGDSQRYLRAELYRRALDNVIIERFRRNIKYDEVYLNDYSSPAEARERIGEFISTYNSRRPQDALRGKTPNRAYDGHGAQAAA